MLTSTSNLFYEVVEIYLKVGSALYHLPSVFIEIVYFRWDHGNLFRYKTGFFYIFRRFLRTYRVLIWMKATVVQIHVESKSTNIFYYVTRKKRENDR